MILLSAGHFPEQPGACYKGWCEHQEAMLWVREIMSHTQPGVEFVPTGSLKSKVDYVNRSKAILAIEIHFNSAKIWRDLNNDGKVTDDEVQNVGSGALTLYAPGSARGKAYADMFQSELEPAFGRHWNGVMEGWYRMDKDNGPDYFLSKTNCPALILEPEFIHHMETLQKNRSAVCYGLAQLMNNLL